MKKITAICLSAMLCFSLQTAAWAQDSNAAGPIEISSAEELQMINDNLSADYILTADINLEGFSWTPIGIFAPAGESEEEQEIPDQSLAFTGSFDGAGHVISNLTVGDPESIATGLFGCISGADVGGFSLENASAEGTIMVSDVVGYSHESHVHDISVTNGSVTAYASEMSAEGMYGSIVGAGMSSVISNCEASAQITIPEGTANAGIVGGGLEQTSVISCKGTGTITAGDNCYGLGGISGCGFGAEEFTDCAAADVAITAGNDCYWIGGITGYAGGYEDETFGIPVTVFTCCTAENVAVTTGENADGIGELVGSGFYSEEAAEMMGAPFDAPTVYVIADEEADLLTSENGILPLVAGENDTTYVNLFGVILDDANYQTWYDVIAAIVGEDAAADTVSGLQKSISGELYGENAIEAYQDGNIAFDCWYINDVESFTFDGDSITATLNDGSSETHTYEYLGQYMIGEDETMNYMGQDISVGFPCDVYRSTDEAGEFNYFFLRDDTMDTTWHIEFRYGKDLEELQGYFTGPYAYWLAAGIDVAADEQTIKNVIHLFCLENMDYSARSEDSAAQLADLEFPGKWVADLSEMGDEYADVDLYFILDENGHGDTFMNGAQTADFEAYAFDNGEKGDGAGIYVAYSNLEFEAEAADYTILENENGDLVLTFYSDEGIISYIKAE